MQTLNRVWKTQFDRSEYLKGRGIYIKEGILQIKLQTVWVAMYLFDKSWHVWITPDNTVRPMRQSGLSLTNNIQIQTFQCQGCINTPTLYELYDQNGSRQIHKIKKNQTTLPKGKCYLRFLMIFRFMNVEL